MPNGKGTLECGYCKHLKTEDDSPAFWSADGLCTFHQIKLPPFNNNRICCNFEPNQTYHQEDLIPEFFPIARKFACFGIDMQPGTLYSFPYNHPPSIEEIAVLRKADYKKNRWRNIDDAT